MVRADDLAAHPLATLKRRFAGSDWESIDEVYYGCVTQAGEDNRNVARMALLLADLPLSVPGVTVNRLCASSMEAVAVAARGIGMGEMSLAIAGGVESMSRAPWVMPKPSAAFTRDPEIFDTTLGWRFVNPLIEQKYGTISMAETAENVAEKYKIDRASQDRFALASQQKAAKAKAAGVFAEEIEPVCIPGKKGAVTMVADDEHPRADTTLEGLAKLPTPFRKGGTVTAGNAFRGGRRPELHGDRAHPRSPETTGPAEPENGRCRFSGAERSLRRAGVGVHPRVRLARRQREGESEWGCHRAGSSARDERGTPGAHGCHALEENRCAALDRLDVRGCGPGDGRDARASVGGTTRPP
jgi:hypothetical protein